MMPKRPHHHATALLSAILLCGIVHAVQAAEPSKVGQSDKPGPMQSNSGTVAQAAPESKPAAEFDVNHLFANTCGWCHSKGGREQGKGPKLMGTTLTDGEIVYRVKNGKTGYMPSFGAQFNDDQLKAIVAYIRNLKPE
jgi:cytochrome c5